MKCPLCNILLTRCQYESLPVLRCDKCAGYLVGTQRVSDIEKRIDKSTEELLEEAVEHPLRDNTEKLRCPRCKVRMKKEFWKKQSDFHIDSCEHCKLVWFDAGELAQLQLAHEEKSHVQEAIQFQKRHQEMTPAERAEFERNLATLPEAEGPVEAGFREALFETLGQLLRDNHRFP